jgi:hypothetical protein
VSAQKGACPLGIVPGKSLGPIAIGQRIDTLGASGLALTRVSDYGPASMFTVGEYHVHTCGGAVDEVWIEDLRKAPDCVTAPAKIARTIKREALLASFKDCHDAPPRTGGAFSECEGGGVRIGYGMGDFIQVRVGRPNSKLDDQCEDLLDDGHRVDPDAATLHPLIKQTLDLAELAPYWHSDKPGRDPLRVVKHPALGDPPKLKMFGDPIVWIDAAAAKDGAPYFELTSIQATSRRVLITFAYPVEGVRGSAEFAKRGDQWSLDTHSVAEK